MDAPLTQRWSLALVGALGGVLSWALVEAVNAGVIADRPGLVLLWLISVAVAATLAMACPIGLRRAVPRALALAAVTALLVWLGGLRHEDGIAASGLAVLAALAVAGLPVPFLIAEAKGSWKDYAGLFAEAWGIVVRFVVAGAFVGVVWAVVYLSDQVLQIVGLTVIADLLQYWLVILVLSGAVFGLGTAVVNEQADLLSPYPVLRLFRLLLPVVLVVMALFLVMLPFRGLDGLVKGLSPTLLLLTMVGAGVSLVSIAVSRSDADATPSPMLKRVAQAMSLILPITAALATWAVWLRVNQHGLTPERLFVVLVCLLGLGYGLAYAAAVLRGSGWMARIRTANILLAGLAICLAALWLTPVLNAERISARDQLARFDSGRTAVADLDVEALRRWGFPGQAVLDELTQRAAAPDQKALAARLSGQADPDGSGRVASVQALTAVLPVQPAGATGTRDMLVAAANDFQLADWTETCSRLDDNGRPGCLMVVADLLPSRPGEEALLSLVRGNDYVELLGLYLDDAGGLAVRSVQRADGGFLSAEDSLALLDLWREAAPPMTPALVNQLGTGEAGLLFLP